jgi:molybdopterin/thiamine biosynthesis adenylyltransferase
MERYARQEMIEGWDQGRLTRTTLLVVGAGHLARLTSLLATAMGFGRVALLADGRVAEGDRRFLLTDAPEGSSLARTWAEALRHVNPEVEVVHAHDVPCERSFDRLPGPDVVVEASHDPGWKARALQLAEARKADFIAAAAGPQVGLYQVGPPLPQELGRFQGVREDPLVGLVLAALVVEEARRLCLPLGPDDRPAEGPVLVSPEALHRRAGGPFADNGGRSSAEAFKMTLVGAGALGTWAGVGIGLSARTPAHLTIYDPDSVEATNLNRQVLFSDALHEPKAIALAGRLSAMFPEIRAEGRAQAVTEGNLADACGADLVLCGPDTFGARALLHRGALAFQTPLVNGGTSAFGADVAAYVPGCSPCLECSLRVATVAEAVRGEEERAHCAGAAEASVVTSSALAGALMAYEAWAALARRPILGVIEYDGRARGQRLGVRSVKKPCRCHQGASAEAPTGSGS